MFIVYNNHKRKDIYIILRALKNGVNFYACIIKNINMLNTLYYFFM